MPTPHTLHKFFTISNLIEGIDDNDEVLRQVDFMKSAMFCSGFKDASLYNEMLFFHSKMNHLNSYCKPGVLRTYNVYVGGRKCMSPDIIEYSLGILFDCPPKTKKEIRKWHIAFEHIHPFGDGNGRVGRYLMLRQLVDNGLQIPQMFLTTKNFEDNRRRYYKWF